MPSVPATVASLGGIAARRQLLRRGFTGNHLAAALHRDEIGRVRRGWYATQDAATDALIAVRVGGRLSHTSAAASFGLWSGSDHRVHVTVQRGSSRLRAPQLVDPFSHRPTRSVVVHWIEPGRMDLTSSCTWRVSVTTCLREVVRESDAETAVAILDTAVQRYGLTSDRLRVMFAREPAASRAIASRCRRGSDSGCESITRQRFEALGIAVRQQVVFAGIRRVDMLIGHRVIVEIDGRSFRATAEAFERDRRQDAELAALGYVVLRFSYLQVMFDWSFVERTVLATLAA